MKKEDRLREIIEYLKTEHGLTNEALSFSLEYSSGTYVSDVLGSKGATHLFLNRLRKHYRVNPEYIEKGSLPKLLEKSSTAEGKSDSADIYAKYDPLTRSEISEMIHTNRMQAEAILNLSRKINSPKDEKVSGHVPPAGTGTATPYKQRQLSGKRKQHDADQE